MTSDEYGGEDAHDLHPLTLLGVFTLGPFCIGGVLYGLYKGAIWAYELGVTYLATHDLLSPLVAFLNWAVWMWLVGAFVVALIFGLTAMSAAREDLRT